MKDSQVNELSFKPTFYVQSDEGSWQLRRDIALVGQEGKSQIGLELAMKEALKIKDEGGELYIEPEREGAGLARASIDMWNQG